MAEHVAGRLRQRRPGLRALEYLVQSSCGEALPAVRALQDDEDTVVAARRLRPLCVEVRREGGEAPARDRDDPLMAALARGDVEPAVCDVDVAQPKAEHLASAQPGQQPRQRHRCPDERSARARVRVRCCARRGRVT